MRKYLIGQPVWCQDQRSPTSISCVMSSLGNFFQRPRKRHICGPDWWLERRPCLHHVPEAEKIYVWILGWISTLQIGVSCPLSSAQMMMSQLPVRWCAGAWDFPGVATLSCQWVERWCSCSNRSINMNGSMTMYVFPVSVRLNSLCTIESWAISKH